MHKKGLKCAPVVELAKLVILCQQPWWIEFTRKLKYSRPFSRFIKFEEEDDKINLAEFLYMQSIVDKDK